MFFDLREHRVQEGKVVFPVSVSAQGDVVISVYHMRSHALQAKVWDQKLNVSPLNLKLQQR